MNAGQKNKKRQYTRDDFSDKEVFNEIKDSIKQIRDRNLKQVQEDLMISNLYESTKQKMKIKKMKNNEQLRPKLQKQKNYNELGEQDEQEGQIKKPVYEMQPQMVQENAPSIKELGQHIRSITITRNKMGELLKSRKFQDIIKGCFVRYKSENSSSYYLALVVGIFDGDKQYLLNNIKTKTLLRLQQSTSQIIKLSLDHVSNQHPPGSLQISKWLQTNRNKIPKEKELKQKLQQLNNLIHGKVSSQQIDRNLLKQAKRVADDKAEGTENLSELIFFMRNQIHDLVVTLQQIQGDKQKYHIKNQQKKAFDQILTKLITKQAQLKQQQKMQKQEKQKKQMSKKLTEYAFESRKQDKIKEHYHDKILSISSFQGINRFKNELIEAHKAFDINVDV